MGKARLLILLIAIGAGGAAFFLVSTGDGGKVAEVVPKNAGPKMVEVMIARDDIPQGAMLSQEQIHWIKWPEKSVPDFYVTRGQREFLENLSLSRARQLIRANEPVTGINTVQHGNRGMLATVMGEGMRAVSMKVKAEEISGGLILPGDRVDIYSTGRVEVDGEADTASMLLFENVRVLAIDQAYEQTDGENAIVGKTVTIELLPDQIEPFLAAREEMTITLALRSLFETDVPKSVDKTTPDQVIVLRYGQG